MRGKGYWKFNPKHLQDPIFVHGMNSNIEKWLNQYSTVYDKRVKWELVKYEIRKYCMKFGSNKKKQQNIQVGNLLKELHDLEIELGETPSDHKKHQFETIQNQLKNIETESAKGAIIRSKAKWMEEGEKPTKYFLI